MGVSWAFQATRTEGPKRPKPELLRYVDLAADIQATVTVT
jgi:hypothetical protein